MMAALEGFIIAFLIFHLVPPSSCDEESENKFVEDCEKQTSYSLTGLQSLKIDLRYDAAEDGLDPDKFYIQSMCKTRKLFKHVTFSFFVGLDLQRDENGKLECASNDGLENTDCTYAYQDACASQLVSDFTSYVCCNYSVDKSMTAEKCVQKQNANVDEFNKCAQLQDPKIKPDEILLKNSQDAKAAFPSGRRPPFLGFNGQNDLCAQIVFYDNPEKVICAMLAEGVEEKCKKPSEN